MQDKIVFTKYSLTKKNTLPHGFHLQKQHTRAVQLRALDTMYKLKTVAPQVYYLSLEMVLSENCDEIRR
ncbi:hypothetical protein OIU77_016554 [Salix suchowensis]|uniref:Ribosomal protein L33 n=1 Tax=Salix suchowensis TaxID=1278906 RepID=A0ABQ8ZL96_9ROSI|nr:hypothetical protein OIU77_016554 [Salix suchowensis]KAJ6315113.1 hypothetical protein OIU78_018576 [Salix suchowensis]